MVVNASDATVRPARRGVAVRIEGLSVDEAAGRVVEQAFGADRPRERRLGLLEVLTYSAVVFGAVAGIVGVLIGVAIDLPGGVSVGHVVARGFGVILTAPLMAIGFVWAGRWTIARRDRPGEAPSDAAQPGTRDLPYAAPIAVLLAPFFVLV